MNLCVQQERVVKPAIVTNSERLDQFMQPCRDLEIGMRGPGTPLALDVDFPEGTLSDSPFPESTVRHQTPPCVALAL